MLLVNITSSFDYTDIEFILGFRSSTRSRVTNAEESYRFVIMSYSYCTV